MTIRGNAGTRHWNWRGGRREASGRVRVYAPDHPRAKNEEVQGLRAKVIALEARLARVNRT